MRELTSCLARRLFRPLSKNRPKQLSKDIRYKGGGLHSAEQDEITRPRKSGDHRRIVYWLWLWWRHTRRKVEALFAELKNYIGLRRLRLRRMRFVREQFYLAATAQNLKRLVRFLSCKPTPQIATA